MSTVIERKIPVEAKWDIAKIREMAAMAAANNCMSTYATIEKSPELIKEYDKHVISHKVEYFKKLNVKTPIELAKAVAEFETNVFGSKIEIQGDEHKAILTYQSCACFDAMKKTNKITPEHETKMGGRMNEMVEHLAREFGFKGSVQFEGPIAIVTYTK